MKNLTIEELKKMTQSDYVCTLDAKIIDEKVFGDSEKHQMKFDVFDGFAHCNNYNGKEYILEYPKKNFIQNSPTMKEEVIKYLELEDNAVLTEIDSLKSYFIIKENK